MQITGYSSYATNPYAQTRSTTKSGASESGASNGEVAAPKTSAADAFLAEAKKTPAQRIRDDWLARHKMSEEDLQSMDSKKREAIEKEIAEEIKRKLSGKDAQRGAALNMVA
ncbi:hypothetical protein [Azospirillum cavernae]|nr:hypothetical protein [Azospirillum cavernae]